jgi:hypothetical protein
MIKSSGCSKNPIKREKIGDISVNYEVENRNVRYPRLEFKKDKVLIVLPKGVKSGKDLLRKKHGWILKKYKIIEKAKSNAEEMHKIQKNANKSSIKRYTEVDLRGILSKNLDELSELYSKKLRVKVNRIFIRKQKTKWASCSENRNLSFNLKLVQLPENLMRYVVYHEMVHIKERKHNRNFWLHVRREFPNYKEMEKLLLGFWFYLDNYD